MARRTSIWAAATAAVLFASCGSGGSEAPVVVAGTTTRLYAAVPQPMEILGSGFAGRGVAPVHLRFTAAEGTPFEDGAQAGVDVVAQVASHGGRVATRPRAVAAADFDATLDVVLGDGRTVTVSPSVQFVVPRVKLRSPIVLDADQDGSDVEVEVSGVPPGQPLDLRLDSADGVPLGVDAVLSLPAQAVTVAPSPDEEGSNRYAAHFAGISLPTNSVRVVVTPVVTDPAPVTASRTARAAILSQPRPLAPATFPLTTLTLTTEKPAPAAPPRVVAARWVLGGEAEARKSDDARTPVRFEWLVSADEPAGGAGDRAHTATAGLLRVTAPASEALMSLLSTVPDPRAPADPWSFDGQVPDLTDKFVTWRTVERVQVDGNVLSWTRLETSRGAAPLVQVDVRTWTVTRTFGAGDAGKSVLSFGESAAADLSGHDQSLAGGVDDRTLLWLEDPASKTREPLLGVDWTVEPVADGSSTAPAGRVTLKFESGPTPLLLAARCVTGEPWKNLVIVRRRPDPQSAGTDRGRTRVRLDAVRVLSLGCDQGYEPAGRAVLAVHTAVLAFGGASIESTGVEGDAGASWGGGDEARGSASPASERALLESGLSFDAVLETSDGRRVPVAGFSFATDGVSVADGRRPAGLVTLRIPTCAPAMPWLAAAAGGSTLERADLRVHDAAGGDLGRIVMHGLRIRSAHTELGRYADVGVDVVVEVEEAEFTFRTSTPAGTATGTLHVARDSAGPTFAALASVFGDPRLRTEAFAAYVDGDRCLGALDGLALSAPAPTSAAATWEVEVSGTASASTPGFLTALSTSPLPCDLIASTPAWDDATRTVATTVRLDAASCRSWRLTGDGAGGLHETTRLAFTKARLRTETFGDPQAAPVAHVETRVDLEAGDVAAETSAIGALPAREARELAWAKKIACLLVKDGAAVPLESLHLAFASEGGRATPGAATALVAWDARAVHPWLGALAGKPWSTLDAIRYDQSGNELGTCTLGGVAAGSVTVRFSGSAPLATTVELTARTYELSGTASDPAGRVRDVSYRFDPVHAAGDGTALGARVAGFDATSTARCQGYATHDAGGFVIPKAAGLTWSAAAGAAPTSAGARFDDVAAGVGVLRTLVEAGPAIELGLREANPVYDTAFGWSADEVRIATCAPSRLEVAWTSKGPLFAATWTGGTASRWTLTTQTGGSTKETEIASGR